VYGEYWKNGTNREKTEELGKKTCPSADLSTTNPKWTDPGENPDLRGERQATNHLSHGTTFVMKVY
jgi:hypothetical protein